ncbi:hypothetical protein B5S28_g4912 [[Candida] boidinii]|nr:hypothetical protein B5S28_g4912 [[Candida] boidinii]OWB64094.1 hypothetical protein B5S29_g5132 [[Candida] boidinii]
MLRQTRNTMSVIKKEVETGKVSKYFGSSAARRTRSSRASVVKTEDDEEDINQPDIPSLSNTKRTSDRLQRYKHKDDSISVTTSVKKEEFEASIPSSSPPLSLSLSSDLNQQTAAKKKRRLTKVKVEIEQHDAIPTQPEEAAAGSRSGGARQAVPVPAADLADALVADQGRGQLHGDADAGRPLQDGHGIHTRRALFSRHAGN